MGFSVNSQICRFANSQIRKFVDSQIHKIVDLQIRRFINSSSSIIIIILLVAAFFRFHNFGTVPPGPSHDELRMIELGEMIVQGARPIHWTVSFSPEPLYMYLLALVMPVFGYTPFAARLVTGFAGLLLIPAVYTLTRRLYGRSAAILASVVLAVTWWPVLFSRLALRGILLPLVDTIAIYALWRGIEADSKKQLRCWALAGCLFGISWYTFTAARGLLLLLPVVFVVLIWQTKNRRKQIAINAFISMGTAFLIIIPFIYDTHVNPGAPESRIEQLGGVIDQVRTGNFKPLINQTLATVGMVAFKGDPNWRYNISGQPAFGFILGIFTFWGIGVCIIRWKSLENLLLLVWFLLGCAPSALATEAPSFMRAIGALAPAAVLAGIGIVKFGNLLHFSESLRNWFLFFLFCLITYQGVSTFLDLNYKWPKNESVRDIYQAALTEAITDLNTSSLEGRVWISEPFPDDRHEMLAERLLKRKEIKIRWFNADRALILPPAQGDGYYLFPEFSNPDPGLFDMWMSEKELILGNETKSYKLFRVQERDWMVKELLEITDVSSVSCAPDGGEHLVLPIGFNNVAYLLGYEIFQDKATRGQDFEVVIYWKAEGPVYEPLSSFVHLIDEQDNIAGQYDGMDVPARRWKNGDLIAQSYKFTIDTSAAAGSYWLSTGLYKLETMERIPANDGGILCNRLFIDGRIEVR